MAKKGDSRVHASPDVELAVLRYLQAATSLDKLTRITGADGKPALSKRAAEAILRKTRQGSVLRSLSELANIPGVGAPAVQATADFFAARVIEHDRDLHRIGGELIDALNRDLVLAKLMLVNPARVLTEELAYVLTPAMAETVIDTYAPAYRLLAARHDAFYDKLRRTGQGMHFIKALEFHEGQRTPEKADRPTVKRASPDVAELGGYDLVLQLTEGACLKLLKNLIKDIHQQRDHLSYEGQSHDMAYLAPRGLQLRVGATPGLYFQLPFSLDTGQDNPVLPLGRLLTGRFGVLLRPQSVRADDGVLYVGTKPDILRKIVLHVRDEHGRPLNQVYDVDAEGALARSRFDQVIEQQAPGLHQATPHGVWRRFERLIESKLAAALGSSYGVALPDCPAPSDYGIRWSNRIEAVDFAIGDAGGLPAMALGVRMQIGEGEYPVHWASSAGDLNVVPWLLEPERGDFAAVAGALAWDSYANGWGAKSGYTAIHLPPGAGFMPTLCLYDLNPFEFGDGFVELGFRLSFSCWNRPPKPIPPRPGVHCLLDLRLAINGQQAALQWSGDDECWTDYFNDGWGEFAAGVRDAIVSSVISVATDALGLATWRVVTSEQIAQLQANLLAAHGDAGRLQEAATGFMQRLELRGALPNSLLSYFAVRGVSARIFPGGLKVLGAVDAPEVSWLDYDDYGVSLASGNWRVAGFRASGGGRRASALVAPAQRQRLATTMARVRETTGTDRWGAARDLEAEVEAVAAAQTDWRYINVEATPRNLIEPLEVRWEFTSVDPTKIVVATDGLCATVYANQLDGDLQIGAKVTVTDFFARTATSEIHLGDPGGPLRANRRGLQMFLDLLADALLEHKATPVGGDAPAVQPEGDPELQRLLGELQAMGQMKQRRRG